jgi:hypothetical protein
VTVNRIETLSEEHYHALQLWSRAIDEFHTACAAWAKAKDDGARVAELHRCEHEVKSIRARVLQLEVQIQAARREFAINARARSQMQQR